MTRLRTAVIQHGDTLQAIAARELGDWSRWGELVQLNGLCWPFIKAAYPATGPFAGGEWVGGSLAPNGRGGRVLQVGERLLLPVEGGEVLAPTDPIGTDLSEVAWAASLVPGVENLRGALLRRLLTPLGYLPHHPEYGSRLAAMIGEPLTLALVLDARAEVHRVLSLDPRVNAIRTVAVDIQEDALFLNAVCDTDLGALALDGRVLGGGTR